MNITVSGSEALQAKLKDKQVIDIILKAVAEYLVGDMRHGLKHYPTYKYVNRQAGFGAAGDFIDSSGAYVPPGFVSAKQHRYVMAAIHDGRIQPGFPHRTGNLQRGWTYAPMGDKYVISNPMSYAPYVMGNQQTQMHNLIGWRRYGEVIQSNIRGAIQSVRARVREWFKSH